MSPSISSSKAPLDNDATDNPVFVDEEGKMLEAPLFIKEELKNGIDFDPTKLCLDWLLENAHVILWWCNGGRNQNWTMTNIFTNISIMLIQICARILQVDT